MDDKALVFFCIIIVSCTGLKKKQQQQQHNTHTHTHTLNALMVSFTVGDSIFKDINERRLHNTGVPCVRGGKIEHIDQHLIGKDPDNLKTIIIHRGSNKSNLMYFINIMLSKATRHHRCHGPAH